MKNLCRDLDMLTIWKFMQYLVRACNELQKAKVVHRDINLKNLWISFKGLDLDIILSKGRERELCLRNIDFAQVQFDIKLGGFKNSILE